MSQEEKLKKEIESERKKYPTIDDEITIKDIIRVYGVRELQAQLKGIQIGKAEAKQDEIKFLERIDINDLDEMMVQVDGVDIYLDNYIKKRLQELKR